MNADHKANVLIVDDERGILDALATLFRLKGYAVSVSANDAPLKEINGDSAPDLIILDVLLSGRDGRQIVRELRSRDATRNIPVIMISASPEAERTSLEAGANDFIAKPFAVADLLARVGKFT